jgi:hypothetical protein
VALVQATVTAEPLDHMGKGIKIVDARDGSDKVHGEIVVLDDERTVIRVLVEGGLISAPEPYVAPAEKPAKKVAD